MNIERFDIYDHGLVDRSPTLTGQCALVTGSTRGIGRAIVLLLAAHGARVIVHGRNRDTVEEVRREVESLGGTAIGVRAVLTGAEAVQHVRRGHDSVGTPDIVVANAFGSPVRASPIEQISLHDWPASIDGNLTATFLTVKAFTPGMKQRGSGAIATMSSAPARRLDARSPAAYAAAKAGIELLTQDLAAQVGPYGVPVNCIAPETIMISGGLRISPGRRRCVGGGWDGYRSGGVQHRAAGPAVGDVAGWGVAPDDGAVAGSVDATDPTVSASDGWCSPGSSASAGGPSGRWGA